jgi:hypothetical protein
MKNIREDKASGIIIHTYMEISEGNSLSSYIFHFIFSHFSPTKLENSRVEEFLPQGGWGGGQAPLRWGSSGESG